MTELNLNLGSGETRYPGWVNVDYTERVKPDYVADVRELPFEDESVDAILASHLLEHFRYPDDGKCLAEWYRVLKVGGLCTVVVPDIIGAYHMMYHGGVWGHDAHPMDINYLNAIAYGGSYILMDAPAEETEHQQIFIFDMLIERMRPFFPDARQVPYCRMAPQVGRASGIGETMVTGKKY